MKEKGLSINLLSPSEDYVKYLGEITSLNSIETSGTQFDPDGLYSVEFFGVSGSKERMVKFAYINMRLEVIHPKIYESITTLDGMFPKIIAGKLHVKLDKKTGEFIEDDSGETGYTFFVNSIKFLKFKRNESKQRDSKIDLIYKAVKEKKVTYSRLLVLPAGMRDYEILADGRPSEDEINDKYRAVIRDKDLIGSIDIDDDLSLIDPIRAKLQDDINNIYDYIKTLIDGKHKFTRGKWIKAGVTNGTRNVFSGIPTKITNIDDPDNIGIDTAVLGVLQTAKAFLPLSFRKYKEMFLDNLTDFSRDEMLLLDRKFTPKRHKLKDTDFDRWTTRDGVDSVIYRTISDSVKNSPIIIDNHYLALINDLGDKISIVTGEDVEFIDDKTNLRPMTYGELMFFITKDIVKKYPITLTRHPVIENGSTYYAFVKLLTTTEDRIVTNIKTGEVYKNYPLPDRSWINTIGLHYSRLAGMQADFDGDTGPAIGYQTIDAAEEAKRIVNSPEYYIDSTGNPLLEIIDDVLVKTIKTLTRKG